MTHVTRLPALVTLNQLTYQFANGDVLFDGLDLRLDCRPTGIVGRNGCGKSILARLIAGQLHATSGSLHRHGSVAYVAQEPSLTCGQTIAQAAGVARQLDALARLADGNADQQDLEEVAERWDIAERLRALLDDAGLPALAPHHRTDTLSGGQRARIALIGAFLSQADLLVLDEPTNHLDVRHQFELMNLIRGLSLTTLAALHELPLAAHYCDRIYLLQHGALVAQGTPAEVLTPETIARVYGVRAQVHTSARTGKPVIEFMPDELL